MPRVPDKPYAKSRGVNPSWLTEEIELRHYRIKQASDGSRDPELVWAHTTNAYIGVSQSTQGGLAEAEGIEYAVADYDVIIRDDDDVEDIRVTDVTEASFDDLAQNDELTWEDQDLKFVIEAVERKVYADGMRLRIRRLA